MTIEVSRYSKELCEQILKEVKETGNMALVARSRGISYTTIVSWVNAERRAPQREYKKGLKSLESLLRDAELENRRFLGNYGSKKDGYGCMEGVSAIHAKLVENRDCPQDSTSEWLQRLFPSQDGVNFVANQVGSDPISQHCAYSRWSAQGIPRRCKSSLSQVFPGACAARVFHSKESELKD